jgi:shikimate kinase
VVLAQTVTLIGLPGAGKTTIGRQIARRLDAKFVDTDALIEKELGCKIVDFFAKHGEAAFRDAEQTFLTRALAIDGGVVSTGGGIVIRDANRSELRDRSKVVYLHTVPEELVGRMRHDRSRPLLQGVDPLKKLRELYAERDPLYRQTAHFVVEIGRPSVAMAVSTVLMQLELAGIAYNS